MSSQGTSKKFKADTSSDSGSVSLIDLADIPILLIAKYLSPKDLVSFSHVNQRLFKLFDANGVVWRNALKTSKHRYDEVREIARSVVEDDSLTPIVTNVEKLNLMMHLSLKKNWENLNFQLAASLPNDCEVSRDQHPLKVVAIHKNKNRENKEVRGLWTFNTLDVRSGRQNEFSWNTEIGKKFRQNYYWEVSSIFVYDSIVVAVFAMDFECWDMEDRVYHVFGLNLTNQVTDLWQMDLSFKQDMDDSFFFRYFLVNYFGHFLMRT
jgi:hypothetical protein